MSKHHIVHLKHTCLPTNSISINKNITITSVSRVKLKIDTFLTMKKMHGKCLRRILIQFLPPVSTKTDDKSHCESKPLALQCLITQLCNSNQ